ncbi:MAG: class I SAM-dependent methyltransferase [Pseudomonadota bacterium]
MTSEASVPPALFAFFEAMPRQGPGSEAVTRDLYQRVRPLLPPVPVAADMGCGSGAAGLVLAEDGAMVTGVDVHRPYLAALEQAAARRGLSSSVATRCASMTESRLDETSLDLIWSEGAVFTVGFETALSAFMPLLKPGGIVVVSECAWFQEEVPDELRTFWQRAYPAIATVGSNLRRAEALSYRFLSAETLPSEMWEQEFYQPMEALIARHGEDCSAETMEIIQELQAEIDLFRRFHAFYGYVFFVLQKPEAG